MDKQVKIKKQDINQRKKYIIMFTSWIILISFLIIIIRFFYLQIISSDELQEKVFNQRVHEVEQFPVRGYIYDRNGQTLGLSLITYDINVYPNLIKTEEHQYQVSEILSKHLNIPKEEILEKVKTDNYWASIAKKVTPDIVDKIRKENIHGIEYQQSPERVYPKEELAAGILGFVNDEHQPGAGVELYMNRYLSGMPGLSISEYSKGKEIPIGNNNSVLPRNGYHIQLTIDSHIQHILEREMKHQLEELNADSIHGIIMNPKNGKILAMASLPSYNPNEYRNFNSNLWNHTPAHFNYEPGSIIKPLYMAIGFEEGVLSENELLPTGRINLYGTTISDWNNVGWGNLSPEEVIARSSNVAMVEISNRLTEEKVIEYFEKLNFNEKTGIELPGEEKGANFPTPSQLAKDPIRHANISFGQGISITPLQMLTAFNVFANDGYIIQPTLVEKVYDEKGNIIFLYDEPKKEKVFSESTVEIIRSYLNNNMKEGSGSSIQIEGVEMGGKTGTAWYVENGKYKKDSFIGSFIGFLPFENPEYIAIISIKNPQNVKYGSESANPVFERMMKEILSIPKIENEDIEKIQISLPNIKFKFADDAKKMIQKHISQNEKINFQQIKFVETGEGNIVIDRHYEIKNNQLIVTLYLKPISDDEYIYLPNLIGYPVSDIEELLRQHKINYKSFGKYLIKEQNLEPGRYSKDIYLQIWGE